MKDCIWELIQALDEEDRKNGREPPMLVAEEKPDAMEVELAFKDLAEKDARTRTVSPGTEDIIYQQMYT